MRASYWTVIGAMLVPLGVVLVIEAPDFSSLAVLLTIVGVVSIVAGWVYTVRDERQSRRESDLRIRKEKASLRVLVHMAEKLGVDLNRVVSEMEKDDEQRDNL